MSLGGWRRRGEYREASVRASGRPWLLSQEEHEVLAQVPGHEVASFDPEPRRRDLGVDLPRGGAGPRDPLPEPTLQAAPPPVVTGRERHVDDDGPPAHS